MENPSGIYTCEYKVLIKPIEVEEKTEGGIILPDSVQEQNKHAQVKGELVSVSPLAFTYDEWPDEDRWFEHYPTVGDTVLYAKYVGSSVTGVDGVEYRLVNDKDIGAVICDD